MFKLSSLFSVDFMDFQNTDASQAVVCHDDLDTLFDDVSENQQAVYTHTDNQHHQLRQWPDDTTLQDYLNQARSEIVAGMYGGV